MKDKGKVYFDFERLHVYQRAIDFIDFVFTFCKRFERNYKSSVVDQLQRAVLSVGTNIAEGAGKRSRREKIKYFSYALDSAKECIPCLTIAHRQQQISDEESDKARDDCTVICRMLAKLIQSVENDELNKS